MRWRLYASESASASFAAASPSYPWRFCSISTLKQQLNVAWEPKQSRNLLESEQPQLLRLQIMLLPLVSLIVV